MRLYSSAKPNSSTSGFRSISTSPSPVRSSTARLRVLALVGIAMPTCPVRASGFRNRSASGKSPKPLPKKIPGVHVLKVSALTSLLPVPPTSTSRPRDTTASCSSFSTNSYFEPIERLSKPSTALPCEWLSVMNVSPNSMSQFGVMRRAISEEISVSRLPPSSGVTMLEIVGMENSSATKGSSVESVAGKNRAPAKPCP